jgi:hypothetical protein
MLGVEPENLLKEEEQTVMFGEKLPFHKQRCSPTEVEYFPQLTERTPRIEGNART